MELRQVIESAVKPAYAILGSKYNTVEATLMSLAIGGQESKFQSRRQIITKNGKLVPEGPAVSFWQFEKGGGIRGVMRHKASEALARRLCAVRGVEFTANAVFAAMQHDDVLGAGMTRLLLLTDPHKLPKIGNVDEAWACYTRIWRPGKPHIATWAKAYQNAREALGI